MTTSKDFRHIVTVADRESEDSILDEIRDGLRDISKGATREGFLLDWPDIEITTDKYVTDDSTFSEPGRIREYKQITIEVRGVKQ